jgi:CRP/FNR family cyclic AMP-dependent transcriptional regulator
MNGGSDVISRSNLNALPDVQRFPDPTPRDERVLHYRSGELIYKQGDVADTVLYVGNGTVKLFVVSNAGHEAVVGLLGPGDYFGEGCLAGEPVRLESARTATPAAIVHQERTAMRRRLDGQRELADRFIANILTRNIRIEEDLLDARFNASEKRLARALLLLAGFGEPGKPIRPIPRVSHSTLAEMAGTTRSRIGPLMNKFERLGFIDYRDGLKVNKGLLTVVLGD